MSLYSDAKAFVKQEADREAAEKAAAAKARDDQLQEMKVALQPILNDLDRLFKDTLAGIQNDGGVGLVDYAFVPAGTHARIGITFKHAVAGLQSRSQWPEYEFRVDVSSKLEARLEMTGMIAASKPKGEIIENAREVGFVESVQSVFRDFLIASLKQSSKVSP